LVIRPVRLSEQLFACRAKRRGERKEPPGLRLRASRFDPRERDLVDADLVGELLLGQTAMATPSGDMEVKARTGTYSGNAIRPFGPVMLRRASALQTLGRPCV
jgi:hypothetical protein